MNDDINCVGFNYIYYSIQTCKMLDKIKMKLFFEDCYNDLISRLDNNDKKKIHKCIFSKFLNLPVVVSDKIFSAFNSKKSEYLNKENFVEGMHSLYCVNSVKSLVNLTFKIFNFNKDGELIKEDVMILLTYLCSSEKLFNIIEEVIIDFFGDNEKLSFIQYDDIIRHRSSTMFLILLVSLFEKQPFDELVLMFYDKNKKNLEEIDNNLKNKQIENNLNNQEDEMISDPSNKKYFKYFHCLPKIIKRKYGNKNILKFHNDTENENENGIKIQVYPREKTIYSQRQSDTSQQQEIFTEIISEKILIHNLRNEEKRKSQNPNMNTNTLKSSFEIEQENIDLRSKKRLNSFSRFVNNEISNDVLRTKFLLKEINTNLKFAQLVNYKYSTKNNLKKHKLILISKYFFSFEYSFSNNDYKLKEIHPLNGYYVSKSKEITIHDITFHPFTLLNNYGKCFAHKEKFFFCKSRKEREDFLKIAYDIIGFKDFPDYYKLLPIPLGEGKSGKVQLAICKITNENVAVKIINKSNLDSVDFFNLSEEIYLMKFLINFNHPNIVTPIDILEDNSFIYFVMEYMYNGCLEDYLNIESKNIDENKIKQIAILIAEGLSFLDSVRIMHRDLKPQNILISELNGNFKLKISDFGLSKVIGLLEDTNESYGTLVFCAPEILKNYQYNNKVDTWSYGVLLYYLFYGFLPFDSDLNLIEIKKKICEDDVIFPYSLKISDDLKQLIIRCLSKDPLKRISIDQIKLSKWFN